ncbi:hypothetical protein D9M73_50290 [compost metagenome]
MTILKRAATISMIHRAALAGSEASVIESFGLKNENRYHDQLIYSAMIQAGVDRFRSPEGLEVGLNILKDRVVHDDSGEYYANLQAIQAVLAKQLVGASGEAPNADHNPTFPLAWFLADLLYSAKNRTAMITVLPVPKISEYEGVVSPLVISAVGALLESVKAAEITLTVPRFELQVRDVNVMEEILNSSSYSSYSASHEIMECEQKDESLAIENVAKKARDLQRKFSNTLDVNQASLALISLTTKAVDMLCGKLPGTIANMFGDAFTHLLSSNKKLTLYQYGDAHRALLRRHYAAVQRSKTTGILNDLK